ncbi:hypothetical protein ACQPZP_14485 [Spirillospora sp. CA-142024]|uniref:hypothetical protein n=1 Tax=Spirillospora sp. CA-142024 TaxID=3240036 RepID=UPI003D913D45
MNVFRYVAGQLVDIAVDRLDLLRAEPDVVKVTLNALRTDMVDAVDRAVSEVLNP